MERNQKISVEEVDGTTYKSGMSNYKHSLFITHEWVSSVAGDKPIVCFHFVSKGNTLAKLCGIIMRGSWVVGEYLFFYAGPGLLDHTPEVYDSCIEALKRYSSRKGFSRIDMLNYDQQHGWICNVKGFRKRGREEFVRFFDNSEPELQFSKSLMYNVRKAQKANATFHEETSERVLAKMHELLAETQKLRFHKYGTHYSPYPYFRQTKETTDELFRSGLLKLFHVEIDGEIHCVRCAMENNKRMFGMMIASDGVAYQFGLQHFMQYCLLTKLHREGYTYYNVSGTASGEEGKGLAAYKESLGCKRTYLYGTYSHFLSFPQTLLNPFMALGRFAVKQMKVEKPIVYLSKILFKQQAG